MAKQGALQAIFMFILGIYFAIPSEANIGYIIIETLSNTSPPGLFSTFVPIFKLIFSILGIAIILGDINYIGDQIKKGNFF